MEENINELSEEFNNQTNIKSEERIDYQQQILELLDKTNEYPYAYENHPKLIELCKLQSDSEMLDLSRNQMKLYFPLTEELWIEWINDSVNKVNDEESFQNCLNLIQEALNDYFMISICQLKAQFIIDQHSNDVISLKDARIMLDDLNIYCELHPQSYLVWDLILEFEENVLEKDPTNLLNVDRVKNLMLHRISIPNPNLSQIFEKYSPFITQHFNELYEDEMIKANNFYSKATMIWKSLEPYETALIDSSYDWQHFLSYMSFVRFKLKDKLRLISLFERAVYHNSLNIPAWQDYLEHILSEPQPNEALANSVSLRSTKNCPWSSDLWVIRLQNSERAGSTLEELEYIFVQAISYGSIKLDINELTKLFFERIGYIKRKFTSLDDIPKLSSLLETCLIEYYEYAPQGDNSFRLEKLISKIYLLLFEEKDKAVEIWSNTVEKFKNYSNAWLGYIDFTINYGEYEQVRDLYLKGSRTLTDWPEAIFASWLDYEAIYGDISQAQKARHIIYTQRQKILRAQEKALVNQAEIDTKEEAKKERLREKDRKNKAKIRAANKNKRASEADHQNDDESDVEVESKRIKGTHEEPSKRPIVLVSNLSNSTTEDNLQEHFKECGGIEQIHINSNNAYITFKHPLSLDKAETKHKTIVNDSEISITFPHIQEENNVLYVSNLPETDIEELKTLFSSYGSLIQIRLPSKRQGSNRGFAYIHFERDVDASNALELNGHRLNEMEIYVVLSNPTRKGHIKKDRLQEIDYSKLFVGNIPTSVTKYTLVNLFKQYGAIKNINLLPPSKKDGACVAFVDFSTPESGQAALAINSYQLEGNILNVVVCDPNRKKQRPSGGNANTHNNKSSQFKPQPKSDDTKQSLTQFVPRARRATAKPRSRLNM